MHKKDAEDRQQKTHRHTKLRQYQQQLCCWFVTETGKMNMWSRKTQQQQTATTAVTATENVYVTLKKEKK